MDFAGNFTENARRALAGAQDEAKNLGHNYVGTEHLLYGIVSVGDSGATRLLESMGVSADDVRQQVVRLVGKGDYQFNELFGYTPRTKNAIEQSIREMRNLNHHYVGTEHLLLALIRERNSVATRILMELKVDISTLYEKLMSILRDESNTLGTASNKAGADTPKLNQFSRDLTLMAKNGELDPVIGRQKEVERVVQILSRRTKNNPVLIGEPGVGKTAVVEGLAQRIVEGNIPELLYNKRVLSLDLSGMLAGAKFRGEFEERLKGAIDEVRAAENIILFIDEMHTIIGAGAAEGAIDAANILKPALARGEIQAVGATTLDEYRKHVEKDPALERRFQPVMVGEPTPEEALDVLKGLRDRYEAHHKVRISDEALRAAVSLSDRYITDRFLPDKAIDLMDEAASRVRIQSYTAPPNLKDLQSKLEDLLNTKDEAIMNQNYEKAADLRDKEIQLRSEMEEAKSDWENDRSDKENVVGEEEIAHIVSQWVSIPVNKLTEGESERLLHMEDVLHQRVIGQEEAVSAVSRAIRRTRAGLKDPKRPSGSFIFLGPTGVGKTELSKALAEAVFGDEDAMIRVDMSEYMEKHSVSKLVGSPPGYVGFDEGGQLTEKVRRKPYSVILFDEIEKAHPDVFNILLQIMEDGRLTDSKGRMVDFRNTILIMTSNVGASRYGEKKPLGFASGAPTTENVHNYEKMKEGILEELKQTFRPEFLNRIDEIIIFHKLEMEHIRQIVNLMLDEVARRMAEKGIEMELGDDVRELLAKQGFDPMYGARPLRRAIQRMVEDNLSEEILSGNIHFGDVVRASVENERLVFAKAPNVD